MKERAAQGVDVALSEGVLNTTAPGGPSDARRPMRNVAKRRLIELLASAVRTAAPPGSAPVRVLNLGAGMSTVVEDELLARGVDNFICDRVDVSDCAVEHPKAGRVYRCSVEEMPEVASGLYRAVFSVFVLEHVLDIEKACREINRVSWHPRVCSLPPCQTQRRRSSSSPSTREPPFTSLSGPGWRG